jgi:hypothetical protein
MFNTEWVQKKLTHSKWYRKQSNRLRTSHLHQSVEKLSKFCPHLRDNQYVLHESHERCQGYNLPHSKLCAECHKWWKLRQLWFTDSTLAEITVEAGQTFCHLWSPTGSCMDLSLVISVAIFAMWCHLLLHNLSISRKGVCSGSSEHPCGCEVAPYLVNFQLVLKP